MTGNPGAGPHPELDVLADLHAEALDPGVAEEVRTHVAGCAECAAALAALDATRAQLAALADPPLPADVARALDARLETLRAAPVTPAPAPGATAPGEVHPLRPPVRRRWPVSLPGAAAAAVVTLFVTAIGIGALNSDFGGTDDDSTAGVASDAGAGGGVGDQEAGTMLAAAPVPMYSGRDYTSATVVEAAEAAAVARAQTDAMTAPEAPSAAAAPSVPTVLRRLTEPAALASCLTELAEGGPATPLALDYAAYEGSPALVVVLPEGDSDVGVWVVGPGCTAGNADLRYFVRAPRPAQ